MAITPEDVEKIITSDLDTQTFIDLSQCIIDQYNIDDCYSINCSNTIHTYLAAHFIAVSDINNRKKSIEIDEAKDVMQDSVSASVVGENGGLYSTIYGQQVQMFDYMNKLSDLGKPNKESIKFCSV